MTERVDVLLARFLEVCRDDGRIVAAFLGGSHARGEADEHSDVDLCVVATDAAFADVAATRDELIAELGPVRFVEDFGNPDLTFFILGDGTEGELHVVRAHDVRGLRAGPHRTLLDAGGILPPTFPDPDVDPEELDALLRRTLAWFWHELSHFIAAVGRDQPWWAMGQLEALRGHCVTLVRIEQAAEPSDEPYEKLDTSIDVRALDGLGGTFVALDRGAILEAGSALLSFFRDRAPAIAEARGLTYPSDLDRLVGGRLEGLRPPGRADDVSS